MYCSKCGKEIHEQAVICIHCGCQVDSNFHVVKKEIGYDKTMAVVIKVFLILGCLAQCWMIIPLAWCLPITISIFKNLDENKPISTCLKICSLIFVSLISGICLLCLDDYSEL